MAAPSKEHSIADDITITYETITSNKAIVPPYKKILSVAAELLQPATTPKTKESPVANSASSHEESPIRTAEIPQSEALTFSPELKDSLFLASRILARALVQQYPAPLSLSLSRFNFEIDSYPFADGTTIQDADILPDSHALYFNCEDNALKTRFRYENSLITISIPNATLQKLSNNAVSIEKLQQHPDGLVVALQEADALRTVLDAFKLKSQNSRLGNFFDAAHSSTWLGQSIREIDLDDKEIIKRTLHDMTMVSLPYITASDMLPLIRLYPDDSTALNRIFLDKMFREALLALEPAPTTLPGSKPATPVIDAIKNLQAHINNQCKNSPKKQTNYLLLAEQVRNLTQKIKGHTVTEADVEQFKKDAKVHTMNRTLSAIIAAFLGAVVGFCIGAIAGALPGAGIGAAVGAGLGFVGMGVKSTLFNRPINQFTKILKKEAGTAVPPSESPKASPAAASSAGCPVGTFFRKLTANSKCQTKGADVTATRTAYSRV